MPDPLQRATSSPPPTLGEGCVRRFDPEALSADNGTEFPGAAELWSEMQRRAQTPAAAESEKE